MKFTAAERIEDVLKAAIPELVPAAGRGARGMIDRGWADPGRASLLAIRT